MEQELAYSFHLGSDKNKSKLAKKVAKENLSGTTSLSNNAIQNAKLARSGDNTAIINSFVLQSLQLKNSKKPSRTLAEKSFGLLSVAANLS